MTPDAPEATLSDIAALLRRQRVPFALVGGLAVSIRGEVRFTRDVDIAVSVDGDAPFESLVQTLSASGYRPIATVEHELRKRLAQVRLESSSGVLVDLLAASCGIEPEIVARATVVRIEGVGEVPVARAEELLAMKVLSMTDRRLQDRLDAIHLILVNASLALDEVRALLAIIARRGFDRGEDLFAKLSTLLDEAALQRS